MGPGLSNKGLHPGEVCLEDTQPFSFIVFPYSWSWAGGSARKRSQLRSGTTVPSSEIDQIS